MRTCDCGEIVVIEGRLRYSVQRAGASNTRTFSVIVLNCIAPHLSLINDWGIRQSQSNNSSKSFTLVGLLALFPRPQAVFATFRTNQHD